MKQQPEQVTEQRDVRECDPNWFCIQSTSCHSAKSQNMNWFYRMLVGLWIFRGENTMICYTIENSVATDVYNHRNLHWMNFRMGYFWNAQWMNEWDTKKKVKNLFSKAPSQQQSRKTNYINYYGSNVNFVHKLFCNEGDRARGEKWKKIVQSQKHSTWLDSTLLFLVLWKMCSKCPDSVLKIKLHSARTGSFVCLKESRSESH